MSQNLFRMTLLAIVAFSILAAAAFAQSNATGNLTIDDVDISLTTLPRFDQNSERATDSNVQDGDLLDFEDTDVSPGSELRFSIDVRNTFPDSSENDMDDVTATVTIVDIDDGSDLEEESESITIDTGDTGSLDITMTIPIAVLQETFDVLIELEGDGDDGNTYTDSIELKLKVDKETRDVFIEEASLFPTHIKCSGTARLTTAIRNLGSRDENDFSIEIKNPELNLNYKRSDITLEEDPFDDDNRAELDVPINVNQGTRAKSYPIKIEAYLQQGTLWDTKTINLIVEACSTAQTANQNTNNSQNSNANNNQNTNAQSPNKNNQTQPTQTAPKPVSPAPVQPVAPINSVPVIAPTTVEQPSNGFWILFALGNVVLLAIVIGAAIMLLRRK